MLKCGAKVRKIQNVIENLQNDIPLSATQIDHTNFQENGKALWNATSNLTGYLFMT